VERFFFRPRGLTESCPAGRTDWKPRQIKALPDAVRIVIVTMEDDATCRATAADHPAGLVSKATLATELPSISALGARGVWWLCGVQLSIPPSGGFSVTGRHPKRRRRDFFTVRAT